MAVDIYGSLMVSSTKFTKKKNLTVQRTLNEKQSNMQLYNLHNIHKKFVVLIFVIIFPLVMC